jgi:hypothetical protein
MDKINEGDIERLNSYTDTSKVSTDLFNKWKNGVLSDDDIKDMGKGIL